MAANPGGPAAPERAEDDGLRLSEVRHRDIFRYMKSGVAVYEAVDGGRDFILRDLNPAGERISRIARNEAVGRSLLAVFPHMDRYGLLDALRRVYRTGQAEHLPAAFYEDDRRRGWRENFIYKISNGEVVGIYDDVSDRKEAEEAIRASEERLSILFERAPDAYYLNDLKGTFVDGNLAAERLLGYSRAELVGRSFLKLRILSGPALAKAAKLLVKNALGRPTGPDEFVLKRKDGRLVTVEIRTHPVKIGGRTLVLGIARDITERKRAEERERDLEAHLRRREKAASIATLAGGVGHEINNPLNGILNYAQLIKDDPDAGTRSRAFAVEVIREAQRAANIVRSLLSFSRPASETKAEAAVEEIIAGVVEAAEAPLQDKSVRIEVRVPEGIPGIFCNLPQIQQVLLNLVFNAGEAMEEKTSTGPGERGLVRISAQPFDRDGRSFVRLSVEDDGPGIPEGARDRLFDPFFTTKSRALHSGLGLAVSQRIAEEHDGRLWAESPPGGPTRFHLELPSGRWAGLPSPNLRG